MIVVPLKEKVVPMESLGEPYLGKWQLGSLQRNKPSYSIHV